MNLDPQIRRQVLRLFHHNVAIVVAGKGNSLIGATVTWFMQTSFEPPLVTLAIKADSRLHAALDSGSRLVINLVPSGQEALASHFFKPRFREGDLLGEKEMVPLSDGGARLVECPAWLVVRVRRIVGEGDHHLFLTEVVDAGVRDDSATLMNLTETPWKYGG